MGPDSTAQATASGTRSCGICAQPPRASCGTCARRAHLERRRAAISRVQAGSSIRAAAREIGITPQAVTLGLRNVHRKVPNARLRAAIEEAIAADPALSYSEIARRADPPFASGPNVSRLLGRLKLPAKTVNGREYPAHFITEITVENAVRLIRAAGLDPVDFDDI